MSTSPDETPAERTEDRVVTLLSHWLARHVGDEEVLRELESLPSDALEPAQAAAVDELRAELRNGGDRNRGALEMVVRETLEAVALGP